MSVLNPPIGGQTSWGGRLEYRRERARRYEEQVSQALKQVDDFQRHITSQTNPFSLATLKAFWEGEPRATITVRTLGRSLHRDLAADLMNVRDTLTRTERYTLAEFHESASPDLFILIDAIEPDDINSGDGREVAELLQYTVAVRTTLLQHTLTVLNERYPAPRFHNLLEATRWTEAFSGILQEAAEVVVGTQQLLDHQAMAIQSELDRVQARLQQAESEASAVLGPLVKKFDWSNALERAEHEMINCLAMRVELQDALTFESLARSKTPGVIEAIGSHTIRRAPRLGALLLGLVGATAAVPAVGIDMPQPIRGLANPEVIQRLAGSVRGALTVAPRSFSTSNTTAAAAAVPAPEVQLSTAAPTARTTTASQGDERIGTFFRALPETRGRQELTIESSGALRQMLNELGRFGYRADDVLKLLNLANVDAFREPLTLGFRMSDGGRLLLFPTQPTAAMPEVRPVVTPVYTVQKGDTLSAIARAFGVSLQKLLTNNPQFTNPSRIEIGAQVVIPGPTWAEAQRNQPLIRWGDGLDRISQLFGIPVERLAQLNNIRNPEQWMWDGRPLALPADAIAPDRVQRLLRSEVAASPQDETEAAPAAAVAMPSVPTTSPASSSRTAPAAPSTEPFQVHRVQAGDSLATLAEQYDTTITQLMEDNKLNTDALAPGQTVLVRAPRQTSAPSSARILIDAPEVSSGGSLAPGNASTRVAPGNRAASVLLRDQPSSTPTRSTLPSSELVARYGQTTWRSLDEMPPEVREFFVGTVQEVATFFNVRPGDIMGILRAEQNNSGWTLQEQGISSAGAAGVAQVIARTWNGWANPRHDSHAQSLAEIERYGGLGFDWSARQIWLDWKQGRVDRDALAETKADPQLFENGVAAIARHLANWGLTADKAEADPTSFEQRLADAIAVYNSGRPLSVSANYRQSAANVKTVAAYVGEAIATSTAIANQFSPAAIAMTASGAAPLVNAARDTVAVVAPLSELDLSGGSTRPVELASPIAADVQAVQARLAPIAAARVQPLGHESNSNGSALPLIEVALGDSVPDGALVPLSGAGSQVATVLEQRYDAAFGVQLSDRQISEIIGTQAMLMTDVATGKLTAEQAAERLVQEAEARFLAEGQAARSGGRERPWPFVYNAESLQAQRMAVSFMGRMLSRTELDRLLEETNAQPEAIRQRLQSRGDARLFATARHLFTQMLERESRAIPVTNAEVAQLIAPFLAGLDPYAMTAQQVGALADKVQAAIREGAEFRTLNGEIRFAAPPLSPMPSVFKGFGVSVSYQAGGRHTGIDVANPPEADGRQPQIFAVADGTVVHVGPLYCEQANACRGGKSIILDLGNQTYAIYSHNSEAAVKVGDKVKAGQPIGRQGDEGYSFGSHLHFEVHTGAPFSGNWERPFDGGQFVDPMSFMGQ